MEALQYQINHIFLPPRLPQRADEDSGEEHELAKTVRDALRRFNDEFELSAEQRPRVQRCLDMLSAFVETSAGSGHMDEGILERKLLDLTDHGSLVLHIKHQNAGLLLTRIDNELLFESFELLAQNKDVMACLGRLRRHFPGPAVAISYDRLFDAPFRKHLINVLVELDQRTVSHMVPIVRKAGKDVSEIRDTTKPTLVTEMIMGLLRGLGRVATVDRIIKHSREQVLWDNVKVPWHRSAVWLLIRVALQLSLDRHRLDLVEQSTLYKDFILVLLACVLEKAFLSKNRPHDETLFVMTEKISRRLTKREKAEGAPGFSFVASTMDRVQSLLHGRWDEQQKKGACNFDLASSTVQALDFSADALLSTNDMKLGKYLEKITSCGKSSNSSTSGDRGFPFQSNVSDPNTLPSCNFGGSGEVVLFQLADFEEWVRQHLDDWLSGRLNDTATCEQLADCIFSYRTAASQAYTGNPESLSIMFLTMMSLWVACDKSAISIHPLMLNYGTGFPQEAFNSLVLPKKCQLRQLGYVEDHLSRRTSRKSRKSPPWVMRDGGSIDKRAFPVAHFDAFPFYQGLRTRIMCAAEREKQAKIKQFWREKRKHSDLLQDYSAADHEYYYDPWGDERDSGNCRKCSLKKSTDEMHIDVFEHPLPMCPIEAKVVIFELCPPPAFVAWRHVTLSLLFENFTLEQTPSDDKLYGIEYFPLLAKFRAEHCTSKLDTTFIIKSQTKPFKISHYANIAVSEATELNICVNHGCRYDFYDTDSGTVVPQSFSDQFCLRPMCSYAPDAVPAALRKWIEGTGHSMNDVVAGQCDCPDAMSLREFKDFGQLRAGLLLQWQNIAAQLMIPVLNINKQESAFLFLQAANEAGPRKVGRKGSSYLRDSPKLLNEERFAQVLREGLSKSLARIEENWENDVALYLLLGITTKLISCGPAGIQGDCLTLLARIRDMSTAWTQKLLEKMGEEKSNEEVHALGRRALMMALICHGTFDIGPDHLEAVLEDPRQAALLLRSAIIISDYSSAQTLQTSNPILTILIHRFHRLSYQVVCALSSRIRDIPDSGLHRAVKSQWEDFPSEVLWSAEEPPYSHVLLATSYLGDNPRHLQFNLLTGSLLINGSPLCTLPNDFQAHETYQRIFPHQIMRVGPSGMTGMIFSATTLHSGHEVHFGMSEGELIVRSRKGSKTYELVPHQYLRGDFPKLLVSEYAHWFVEGENLLEFRPLERVWITSDACEWDKSKGWLFTYNLQGEARLVNGFERPCLGVGSDTSQLISKILRPLEEGAFIHLILDEAKGSLNIDLPRFRISFVLDSKKDTIMSTNYRGYAIDPNQDVGTVNGLSNKLILYEASTSSRRPSRAVLVPDGSIKFTKGTVGDTATIDYGDERRIQHHFFQVDTLLGQLKSGGALLSKLFLIHLHAVTSHCLPDRLTRRTGTQEALRLLDSAAIRSFQRLREDEIKLLNEIAKISPRRRFYPKNLQDMQRTHWSNLSSLSQDDAFARLVGSILNHAKTCEMFFPEDERKKIDIEHESIEALVDREIIRIAGFRAPQFGAEQFSTNKDEVYNSRELTSSDEELRVYRLSHFLDAQQSAALLETPSLNIRQVLVGLFGKCSVVGPLSNSSIPELVFGVDWLVASQRNERLSKFWCLIQTTLSNTDPWTDRYKFMTFFAGLIFSENADFQVIQFLLAFLLFPDMHVFRPPASRLFSLQEGDKPVKWKIVDVIKKHKLPFEGSDSSEAHLNSLPHESYQALQRRRRRVYNDKVDEVSGEFADHLISQWPCPSPDSPPSQWNGYLNVGDCMNDIRPLFIAWHDNRGFYAYLKRAVRVLLDLPVFDGNRINYVMSFEPTFHTPARRYIGVADIFSQDAPDVKDVKENRFHDLWDSKNTVEIQPSMLALLGKLELLSQVEHERDYTKELKESLRELQTSFSDPVLTSEDERPAFGTMEEMFVQYRHSCLTEVNRIDSTLRRVLTRGPLDLCPGIAACSTVWPMVTPILLLEQLSRSRWHKLSEGWKRCIVNYALAITHFQRAERLLKACGNVNELIKEIVNVGHMNWEPIEFPEYLILEVENAITIRAVQEDIALQMRRPDTSNAVMQLNMGQGKSTVIVPMVAAALADDGKLVRIIVAKPQSKQMLHMLISKLGGLMNRRVYHLPFSRSLKLRKSDAERIRKLCEECKSEGGVLLVQPEHILSFRLMALESTIAGRRELGEMLLQTQHFFDTDSRDIVDESDENFSVKFELIYTMGTQTAIGFSPNRWVLIQRVLDVMLKVAPAVDEQYPDSIEFGQPQVGGFPRTRLLKYDAGPALMDAISHTICEKGMQGFSVVCHREPGFRQAIKEYISKHAPSPETLAMVEDPTHGFYNESSSQTLLLLRGLIACGVLTFAFQQKRWRVNYGLDGSRKPATRLAVPYRAKDSPAPRAEFSHPDVVIVLTCLSYYYGGLQDEELFTAFEYLLISDQADDEYGLWVKAAGDLPANFCHLTGINLKDRTQCVDKIFPSLRFVKPVIDFYLSNMVFSKEMREFPHKLSASGWDIAAVKTHPTTAFSGTNDSKYHLPLTISHLDLQDQKHTNALVLNHLHQPENSVKELHPCAYSDTSKSVANVLLHTVVESNPEIQVILDVGAQILELGNEDVARTWLSMVSPDKADAAIFFNDNDEMCALSRNGMSESFFSSPYSRHITSCLIFLDQAHTRGTDLRLPDHYRAAVTLGPNLPKDQLVQACMRMRKLGHGQSVVFLVSPEIRAKILKVGELPPDHAIQVVDVMLWAVSETWQECHKNMPLWATQGIRYQKQDVGWSRLSDPDLDKAEEIEAYFLEPECQTLDERYRPSSEKRQGLLHDELCDESLGAKRVELESILKRCEDFGVTSFQSATLQEEQERELSPEKEMERQIEKPMRLEPSVPSLHPDVIEFVRTGILNRVGFGFVNAFTSEAFAHASFESLPAIEQFPPNLKVTRDFLTTVNPPAVSFISDQYQKPVQWILTSCQRDRWGIDEVENVVIISSWEANELIPDIKTYGKVHIHMYTPRPSLAFQSLEDLTLYAIPALPLTWYLPRYFVVLLNLFAGQCYLRSYLEYVKLCKFLGLMHQPPDDSITMNVGADGFAGQTAENPRCVFTESPVPFLKKLLLMRRDYQGMERTDLGRILEGDLLRPEDFEGRDGADWTAGLTLRSRV